MNRALSWLQDRPHFWIPIGVFVLFGAVVGAALALRGPDAHSSQRPSEDGWVEVFGGVYKRCDGTTLVYKYRVGNRGGLAVVAESPECAR